MDRSVLYVDIPAFPIAVERVIDPALRGRPVVVAALASARSPVLSASLEAAREGIRAGMPVQAAARRCPGVVVLPPNTLLYRRAAAAVLALLGGYSPLVEPTAPGQAFLDLTGTGRLFGGAPDAAARIRKEVAERLRLGSTAGVATNKLVSRVAARVIRPDGLCDIFPGSEALFLAPLPAGLLPGADAFVRERFEDLGIRRVGDLRVLTTAHLHAAFGRRGERLRQQALGVDDTPVCPAPEAPVLAEEETLAEDSNDQEVLLKALWRLCERAGARLRRLRAAPRRLRVILSHTGGAAAHGEGRLAVPTAADLLLFASARVLLDRVRARRVRVRSLALVCRDFVRGPRQLDLFGPETFGGAGRAATGRIGAEETLAEAVDRIRGRFGPGAIGWGRLLGEKGEAP
jgi:DNA polymerase-4